MATNHITSIFKLATNHITIATLSWQSITKLVSTEPTDGPTLAGGDGVQGEGGLGRQSEAVGQQSPQIPRHQAANFHIFLVRSKP